jgi:hypothetical protein
MFDNQMIKEKTSELLDSIPSSINELSLQEQQSYLENKLNFSENQSWCSMKDLIYDNLKQNNFTVIKNLTPCDHDFFMLGFASFLGTPLKQGLGRDRIILNIKPKNSDKDFEAIPHTDSANWIVPNDLTLLYCIENDQNKKGKTNFFPIDDVLIQLRKDHHEEMTRKILSEEFLFYLDLSFGGKGYQKQPILTNKKINGKNFTNVRFASTYMLEIIEKYDLKVDQKSLEIVDFLEKTIQKSNRINFLLEKGDLLIFHNKRLLHQRETPSKNSTRSLKKMKINVLQEKIY